LTALKYLIPILFLSGALQVVAQEPPYDVQFFVNSRMSGNYFYAFTEQQAPSSIAHVNQKLPVSEKEFLRRVIRCN